MFHDGVEVGIRERDEDPMNQTNANSTILMVDDDPDDFFLAREALKESGLTSDFRLVSDGKELMDYLYRRGQFMGLEDAPMPNLILLDLNMPRKDGREVLAEIKKNPDFRRIPIVIFTTSRDERDISSSYELGASSYITKPATFDDLIDVMKTLGKYWLNVVKVPEQPVADIMRRTTLS
jgi:CheY-like chemotaxis protein